MFGADGPGVLGVVCGTRDYYGHLRGADKGFWVSGGKKLIALVDWCLGRCVLDQKMCWAQKTESRNRFIKCWQIGGVARGQREEIWRFDRVE